MSDVPVIRARRDPKMRARIMSDRHLSYDGADVPLGDRPKHVRAGSGIAWSGERMVLIQDDADWIALIDGKTQGGGVAGLRLKSPSGPKGHGAGHLQLEAVLTAKDWRGEFVLAFGSGSTPPRRCVARVRLGGGDTEMSVFETRKLYSGLAELEDFATTTLNIEGVALLPKGVEGRDGVRLFHRANGKPLPEFDREPHHWSATVDLRLDALLAYLDRCKRDPNATLGTDLLNLRRYDLDESEGVPFTFTDAASLPDGKVVFIAAAEKSEDAGVDGECFGTSLGVIDPDGSARYAVIVERDGTPTRRKAEGLAVMNDKSAFIVIDPESEDRPATLCTVDLTGI